MKELQSVIGALPRKLQRHALLKALIFACPPLRFQKARFNTSGVVVGDLRDSWFRQTFLTREGDAEFYEICSPLVPDGGVMFDVGANFGLCSFGMLGMRPASAIRFHMFEANPQVFALLKASRALHPGALVEVRHGCVTDSPGTSLFDFNAHDTTVGRVSSSGARVPNIVLDEYIEQNGIERIDLLKIDVEGWEPHALAGCRRSMDQGVVQAAFIEISSDNLAHAGHSVSECVDLLRATGFSLFWVKAADLAQMEEARAASRQINFDNGAHLTVVPFEAWPEPHQTDVLAIHRTSKLLDSWRVPQE